jgi:valyl-tRNA synthetase
MLDKTYRPKEVEAKHYASWEGTGAFAAGGEPSRQPFTIMMPPPNVTGSLHIGHALNFTLQDILIRYARMKGRDSLWQPGTDHAGIATQMVVERKLLEDGGPSRRELGREAFVERVWEWKKQSGDTITRQLRRLGASADWERERFTMDEGLSGAVVKAFVDLHKQGLIYRDKRLVNWDCQLQTAVSDLEVAQQETNGHLWHFKYPIEDTENEYITIATTRPETMLGDTAVAVHPDDGRYRHLVGKKAILPIVGRAIPIIADDYADPEQGSGAVKITPAHDFNDFEVGRRHGLEMINILDATGRLNENAPAKFVGEDRFEVRDRVVGEMESLGLLARIEEHVHVVPHGDRSGSVLEPWLTDQWFVDAGTLAKPAIEAVEQGRTRFIPENWAKTYFEWMRNIQPWCISRQLWWGHRIPAWYGPDGEIFVEMTEQEALAAAEKHYAKPVDLARDEDVLDTWFSSGLWPFSTLGWPEKTPELARYYPTDVLVTGFDIIFFWVARMMMMGLHFTGEVPFETVYIHALIRDQRGQKMSKSKNNVIDPLDLIDKFGCDALRFTLTALSAQGRDIKLAEARVEGYRNFATKLWNAARFCQINGCAPVDGFDPGSCNGTVNKWIVAATVTLRGKLDGALAAYRFNEAAGALYQFTWGTFCDWYVEFSKPVLNGPDGAPRDETRATAAWVLDQLLHMLHPIMPFITEELWQQLAEGRASSLIAATWPEFDDSWRDERAEAEIDWVVRLITLIRAVRAEMNVPAAARTGLLLKDAGGATLARVDDHRDIISTLARVDAIAPLDGAVPEGSVQAVLDEATLVLPLAGVIDITKEKSRLDKEIEKIAADIVKLEKKLANKSFLDKAPEMVVEENRERLDDAQSARTKLEEALGRLAAG